MQVTLEFARQHLSELLAAAATTGQPVEITRPDRPVLKLTVTEGIPGRIRMMAIAPWPGELVAPLLRDGRLVLGAGRGEMHVPAEEEWSAMDLELQALMNDGPLFPPADPCAS